MSLNEKGLAFIKERVRPLAVDSLDEAERVIAKELARGPASSTTPEQWARHLAWIIGFDHLIADRKAIHHIVEKIS